MGTAAGRASGRPSLCRHRWNKCEHLRRTLSRQAELRLMDRWQQCQSRWKLPSNLWQPCTPSQLGRRCSWRCNKLLQMASKSQTWFWCKASFRPPLAARCLVRSRAPGRGLDPSRSRTPPNPRPPSCRTPRAAGSLSSSRACWAKAVPWHQGCTGRAACWPLASPGSRSLPSGAHPRARPGTRTLCREELRSCVPLHV